MASLASTNQRPAAPCGQDNLKCPQASQLSPEGQIHARLRFPLRHQGENEGILLRGTPLVALMKHGVGGGISFAPSDESENAK